MNNNLKDIFTKIYQTNAWGGKQSRSGPGSDNPPNSVVTYQIQRLLSMFNIFSVLDIPCGDFKWFDCCLTEIIDSGMTIEYTGADIVKELIELNLKNDGSKTHDFELLDITCDDLPKVNLVFSRDIFGHLSHENVLKALNNIKRSGSRYLLTTSFTARTSNGVQTEVIMEGKRIAVFGESHYDGGWYPINICIEPFNLIPIYLINEDCMEGDGQFKDKCLVLIEIATILDYKI